MTTALEYGVRLLSGVRGRKELICFGLRVLAREKTKETFGKPGWEMSFEIMKETADQSI